MIAYIEKGNVIYLSEKFLILKNNGIGYKVHTTIDVLTSHKLNDVISLWIYTAVRENSIDLYGFLKIEELSFFELLLDVSGIGPKSALSTIAMAPIDTLKRAIVTGDVSYLNKVSGIGKKTAEKIIIELRDKLKLSKEEENIPGLLRDESDILEALKSLGYSQNEAREALKKVAVEIKGTNARVKEALKILGNR